MELVGHQNSPLFNTEKSRPILKPPKVTQIGATKIWVGTVANWVHDFRSKKETRFGAKLPVLVILLSTN